MKYAIPAVLGLFVLAGCQTPPPAGTRPRPAPSAKEQTARGRLEALEQQLADRTSGQAQLSNRVAQIHADLLSAVQEMRDIKVRANDLSVAGESNRLATAAIEAEILEQRSVVLACEKEAAEEAAKVAALQDALMQEQSVREKEKVSAEESKKRALAEEAQKTAAVKSALAREQELRERDQAALHERERQIEDLRIALEERDKLLRAGSVVSVPAVSAPARESSQRVAPEAAPAFKLVAEGNARLRENKLGEAEKAFRDALAINPELIGARVGLAACRYTRGDLPEAKDEVIAVLGEDSRNAQALGLRGLIYWREGNLAAASEVLQKAVRQDPTDSQLQNYLGIVLFERKKQSAALEALTKAVELDPDNGEAQFNLAVVLASGSHPRLDEARQHYEAALRLGSEQDDALDEILKASK